MKKVFKAVAFVLLLILPLFYIFHCYSYPKSYVSRDYESFYSEEKNTVDGIIIGTSVVGYGWSPTVAWDECGTTISNLGSTVQPFGAIERVIEFAKTKQDIKFVVIDLHAIRTNAIANSIKTKNMQRLYMSLHFGIERYKMLDSIFDYTERACAYYGFEDIQDELPERSDFSLYFPFVNFHNRWVDGLKKADYVSVTNKYKGANDRDVAFKVKDVSAFLDRWDTKTGLDDFQKSEMDRLFEYLNNSGLEVLFVNYPSFRDAESEGQLQAACEYTEEKGFPVINMATKETALDIGLDFKTDFCNDGHVNAIGSCKISRYVAKYIAENFESYQDHRGQDGYESWDSASAAYKTFVENGWAKKGIAFQL